MCLRDQIEGKLCKIFRILSSFLRSLEEFGAPILTGLSLSPPTLILKSRVSLTLQSFFSQFYKFPLFRDFLFRRGAADEGTNAIFGEFLLNTQKSSLELFDVSMNSLAFGPMKSDELSALSRWNSLRILLLNSNDMR